MPAAVAHVATREDAAAAALERVRPGDLVLVKGSRGIGTDLVVDRAQGGVRLMLYYLLYLRNYWPVLNVARYITFRTAAASFTALAIGLLLGPWMIRKLREFQIGQVIRQEGPATHRTKAGHPDDGRLADPDLGARADAAVGRPDERRSSGLRCCRPPRSAAIGFADDYLKIVRRSHHGLLPALQDGLAGRRRRSRSVSRCCCSPATTSTTPG